MYNTVAGIKMEMWKVLAIILILSSFSPALLAQSGNDGSHEINVGISEVALLGIKGNGSINLGVAAPTEAGNPVTFGAMDNSIWINYSSIIGSSSDPARTVSVAVSSGNIPSGVEIKVQASQDAGNGGGSVGVPTSQLTLTNSMQTLIGSIGSCYTGSGSGNGHQITYTLDRTSGNAYSSLDFDETSSITVTYILSDN